MKAGRLGIGIMALAGLGCRPEPPARVEPPQLDAPAPAVASEPAPPVCDDPCEVQQLFAGRKPSMLALAPDHLYFVQGGALRRIPRLGGEPELIVEGVEWAPPLVSGEAVFTCRAGKSYDVQVLRVTGEPAQVEVLADAARCLLASHDGWLYFPARGDRYSTWLARAPLSGGAVERLVEVERGLAALTADASHLYFANERDELHRFDPSTGRDELLAEARGGLLEFGLTDHHIVWLEYATLMGMAKPGPGRRSEPVALANFQDVLDFASDGARPYWASVGERSWRRLEPDSTLRSFAVAGGTSSIEVEGSRVWWNDFGEQGGLFTLDTCGCTADVLVASPAFRPMQGPDEEDPVRSGYADGDAVEVEVRDLSGDEYVSLAELYERRPGGTLSPDAEGLPLRFRVGDRYRVATEQGVVDATISGFSVDSGGEGLHFWLTLDAAGAGQGAALAAKADGPKLGPLREAVSDDAAANKYLRAVRAEVEDAGFAGARIGVDELTVVPGKFPAPHVALIAVEAPVADADPDDVTAGYLSGLLLGDAAGNISGYVYTLDERLDSFAIAYLVDIGGDGIEEVGFSSYYYEGGYDHLLEWDGGSAITTTLSGDGA